MRILLILAALVYGLAVTPAVAAPCAPVAMAHHQLTKLGRVPVARGLAGDAGVLMVYADDAGDWTMIVVSPQGMACWVAGGEAWELLPVIGPGERRS